MAWDKMNPVFPCRALAAREPLTALRRHSALLGPLVLCAAAFQSCSPDGSDDNTAPKVYEPVAHCEGTHDWSFRATVEEPEGHDLAQVYVDVYDFDISYDVSVSSLDLADQGDGTWSATTTASEANGLHECSNVSSLEFDFVAIDVDGESSYSTTTPS